MGKALVRVDDKIKGKVEKKIAGTKVTIGKFYDEAAKEKMKEKKKPTDPCKND